MQRILAGWWVMLAACAGPAASPHVVPVVVRPGIEVLLTDSLQLVAGHHVGLVTNQTGIDHAGTSDVDRLLAAHVDLRALFSPEHGFRGAADPGAQVTSTRDPVSGLPIYSLYGRTVAPTDSMLAGLDLLLVDLQDVGARYYTYISTTVEVMRSASRRGIPVVVLDRPNPLGGIMQGNVLDPAASSFVGRLAVPMRHGLTMGEMARLANADLHLGTALRVVRVGGWRRSIPFGATGLPWVPPSPNLPTLEALAHYPGTCLFEGTTLSVGRGSNAPFAQVGAPWLDASAVIAHLDADARQGVAIEPVRFTPHLPGDGKFADTALVGIRLRVTDPATYDPTRTAIALLVAIRRTQPGQFAFTIAHFDRLAGGPALRRGIEAGQTPRELEAAWADERARFAAHVKPFLLY